MGNGTKAVKGMTLNGGQEIERMHIVVTGRVQGVGFRAFTVSVARRLGIKGWVRNRPDGRSVEVVAEGAADMLDEFLKIMRKGPPASNISTVQHSTQSSEGSFHDFTVRY